MVTNYDGLLEFSFPEVHPWAQLLILFMRTLRIPDDDRDYPLPPGLGSFPLRDVDEVRERVPADWARRGGVIMPMYQSEAMWISFDTPTDPVRRVQYPFAVKIATGSINAASGDPWTKGLNREPRQDYLVTPEQPWLDGYCVEKGLIRQFVATPLGAGYTAEEQITGKAEYGGLQIAVYPMKKSVFKKRFPEGGVQVREFEERDMQDVCMCISSTPGMGLAGGGRMRQEIYEDPYDLSDWDVKHGSRCFVHIANSRVWRRITGTKPPGKPPSAGVYTEAGLPWFDWYDDRHAAIKGSAKLAGLKSVARMRKEKKAAPLPDNESVTPQKIVVYDAAKRKKRSLKLKG